MPEISVRLRIVGLYFNETVKINDKQKLTVRDVLDKYISEHPDLSVPGGLEYVRFPLVKNGKDYVKTFNYHFGGNYNYDGDTPNLTVDDGTTLGKNKRDAGVYSLSEDLEDEFRTPNIGLVWQYYVVADNGDGVVKSKTPPDRSFTPFGAKPDYDIADGDLIIWRLVAIARKPAYVVAPAH
jgi:hypothetical protein